MKDVKNYQVQFEKYFEEENILTASVTYPEIELILWGNLKIFQILNILKFIFSILYFSGNSKLPAFPITIVLKYKTRWKHFSYSPL